MQLSDFMNNHPELVIKVIPFEQTEERCFAHSNAWLQWFLSTNFNQIGLGQFDDTKQHVINQTLPDSRTFGYPQELKQSIARYKLAPTLHRLGNYPDLLSSTGIPLTDYCNEGGLIFAKDSPLSPKEVGHVLCFGIRRSKHYPDKAIFGFFDANMGMIFIELNNFPATRSEMREEIDHWNDTNILMSTCALHDAAINIISNFFVEIGRTYDYKAYHCDKVHLSKPRSPSSSPIMNPTRLTTKSPVLYSYPRQPTSPRTLSSTLRTIHSIYK